MVVKPTSVEGNRFESFKNRLVELAVGSNHGTL